MNLNGPYELDFVDLFVAPGQVGVYALSRDGKHADYVGRSDDDLRKRIKSSSAEGHGYNFFWFQTAGNDWEAYELELQLYRSYNPSDNSIEPAPPRNALYSLLGL